MKMRNNQQKPGGLVISLDFELFWGVRDLRSLDKAEQDRLLVAREMVPKILDIFEEFSVSATWATVGLLFARSREEAEAYRPTRLPGYLNEALNPFFEEMGRSEEEDPFHFAPSLIELISSYRNQEIASHSYSHYYSMEPGQTVEEFDADLASAVAIAGASGYKLESYVFPRNQANPAYLDCFNRYGILTYRGTESAPGKRAHDFSTQQRLHRRAVRLLDAYVNVLGDQCAAWPGEEAPASVAASRYLRPCGAAFERFESVHLGRIRGQMKRAAQQGELFHLWWHPEDFANGGGRNLSMLRSVLDEFCSLREQCGMVSLTMAETFRYVERLRNSGDLDYGYVVAS